MPTYTDLEDVKRVLRTLSGEKIRFSNSVIDAVILKPNNSTNLDLSFDYRKIQFNPDFGDHYMLKLVMDNSTNFKAYEVNTTAKRELLLSSGDILNSYTTPDNMITIVPECWGGVISTGDKIEIRFSPHMSDSNGNRYIEDSEVIIDQILEANGIHFPIQGQSTIFLSGEVPPPIKVSATYLSAYMIYTDTFSELYVEDNKDKNTSQTSFLNRWKKRSEDVIKDYITAKGARAPQVYGFPWFIDSIGDPAVGPGLSKITSDFDEITRDADSSNLFGD